MIPAAILAALKSIAGPILKALSDWRVWAVIAVILMVLWGLHETRRADGAETARKAAQAALEAVQKASATKDKQTAATATVDLHTSQATAQTQATTNTNLQTLRAYVSPLADSKCIIGTGAVRVLQYAAADEPVPAPAIGLQDADSGVALSDLVQADIVNAGNFHQLSERLKAWDDWYDAQSAIANSR